MLLEAQGGREKRELGSRVLSVCCHHAASATAPYIILITEGTAHLLMKLLVV